MKQLLNKQKIILFFRMNFSPFSGGPIMLTVVYSHPPKAHSETGETLIVCACVRVFLPALTLVGFSTAVRQFLPSHWLWHYLVFSEHTFLSLSDTHTHTCTWGHARTYTSISYLQRSHPETTLPRKANMFLNPPAEEKSIVFCSPTLENIANTVSSAQFTQLLYIVPW